LVLGNVHQFRLIIQIDNIGTGCWIGTSPSGRTNEITIANWIYWKVEVALSNSRFIYKINSRSSK
jgi:hypothetical protein